MTTYTVYYRDPESHELVPHPDHTGIERKLVPGAVTLRCNGWTVKEDPQPVSDAGENPKDRLGSKKVDLSLVPPAAIEAMARALEEGAAKYGPFNWRENRVKARVYVAAAMRHIGLWLDGEECAQDSGNHHIDNALGSLAVLKDAISLGNLEDDRPTPGRVSYERRDAAEPEAEARYWVEVRTEVEWVASAGRPKTYTKAELRAFKDPFYKGRNTRAVNVDDSSDTFLLSELDEPFEAKAEPAAEARYRVEFGGGGFWEPSVYLQDAYTLEELKLKAADKPGRYRNPNYQAVNIDDPSDTFLLSELEC